MSARMLSTRLLGPIAAIGLIAAINLPAGAAQAASNQDAVTCPTVNPATGQVTPGWANGVDWAGCDLAGADLEYAELSNAELAGANFTGADFQNADLSGSDLTDADLSGAKLEATNLSGTILAGATLTNASSGGVIGPVASLPPDWSVVDGFLVGPAANLTYANLLGSDLTGVDLSGANLTNANVKQTTLSGVNLTGATLTGIESGDVTGTPAALPANWSLIDGYLIGAGADLSSADLIGADLAGLDLDGADLAGADFSSANLTDADLSGATLTEANLGGADLTGATLTGTQQPSGITGTPAALPANWTLQSGFLFGPGVGLPGANLYKFDLSSLDLAGADLSNADLLDVNLTGADMENADLSSAELNGAAMANADLSNADLSEALLEDNSLADANLSGANLTDAALQEADLAGINLTGATLTGIATSIDYGTPAELPADWMYQGGYLIGPGARLSDAVLTGLQLTGADLAGASLVGVSAEHVNLTNANLTAADFQSGDLSFANLSGANLSGASLSYTNLSYANLTNANLDDAGYTGGTFAGVLWDNTTCPDGSNSNDHVNGCFTALGTPLPEAAPVVTSGTVGRDGWYTSAVTVTWNWSDPTGTINTSDCTKSSTSSGEGALTLSASCANTDGTVGSASYLVAVDTTRPQVTLTGLKSGARYAVGAVPVAGCKTSESVSGLATAATLQPTSGTSGLGEHTVMCAGAVSTAGLTAKQVHVSYSVLYGFAGFQSPKAGSTIAKSAHHFTVLFRLVSATGATLGGTTAARLGSKREVRVTLSGPGVKAVDATCRWLRASDRFRCSVPIPAAAKTGKSRKYSLTAEENLGWGFVAAPAVGGTASQETVHFK